MNEYLLSVCIPTYNGSKTIKSMLDILLPQIDSRVEVIISDNCSTDTTKDIIESYCSEYKINYVRNEKNIGPDANYLQCMRIAKGRFTYLISDDDILVEGGMSKILKYLESHADVSLVYLESVGFSNKYEGVKKCHYYKNFSTPINQDIYTKDRKEFMKYSIRMWGFLSSFLWRTDKMIDIVNPEQYFGTYWLQSYIHALCVTNSDDYLGVIKGPILAAGEYMGINNFSCDTVDGVYYKQMMDFTISNSHFDKKLFYRFYIWRLCFLGRLAVIKEKEIKIKKTSKRKLFSLTYKHIYAWFNLYPYFFVPRWIIILRKKILHRQTNDVVKRL